jgi:hypothetical protein
MSPCISIAIYDVAGFAYHFVIFRIYSRGKDYSTCTVRWTRWNVMLVLFNKRRTYWLPSMQAEGTMKMVYDWRSGGLWAGQSIANSTHHELPMPNPAVSRVISMPRTRIKSGLMASQWPWWWWVRKHYVSVQSWITETNRQYQRGCEN